MVKKLIQIPVVCAGIFLVNLGVISDAKAVSFHFGNRNPQLSNSFNYSNGGISFTASAFNQISNSSPRVSQSFFGLGVFSGNGDSLKIDGSGPKETLRLTFDKSIRLVSATFSKVSVNDGAEVTFNGAQLFSGNIPNNHRHPSIGTVAFAGNTKGSIADFSVTGTNDDYYLHSINVEKVPEPLTVLGTGLALGVGAVLERKRSKANTVKAS